jgi:hypothetical protein
VLVIRCTRKLLDRVGSPVADPPPSTTRLGDWYAKPFGIAQRRYVVLASANARIAVLTPGRDLRNPPTSSRRPSRSATRRWRRSAMRTRPTLHVTCSASKEGTVDRSNKCINLMRRRSPIHWGRAAHRLCTRR